MCSQQDSPATAIAVPYVLEESEGEQLGWFGATLIVKASGPGFDVALTTETAGSEPPLHAHPHDDEALYVLEGALTVFAADEVLTAPTGSFVFLPRGVPHTFVVESDRARLLLILAPSGALSSYADAQRRLGELHATGKENVK